MVRIDDTVLFPIVYEDIDGRRNLISDTRRMSHGRGIYDRWVHFQLIEQMPQVRIYHVGQRPRHYVYPIGLFNAPRDWMAAPGPFARMPADVREDAKHGRVLLIMDQAQEGNSDPDLWTWFYQQCADHGIDPRHVLYLTSDHKAECTHTQYCVENVISRPIGVISSLFNLYVLNDSLWHQSLSVTNTRHARKTYLYTCLNRMPHDHRIWLWLELLRADLLRYGLVSMSAFSDPKPMPDAAPYDPQLIKLAQSKLPMSIDNPRFDNLFTDIPNNIYSQAYFAVVTETYVDDAQMLIGEKVFKPMMCGTPFMLLSTAGSLHRLRELGFKTFSMLWDESYDDLPVTARITQLVRQIDRVRLITDKAEWISQAADATRHNHAMAWRCWSDSEDWQRILAIWRAFMAK